MDNICYIGIDIGDKTLSINEVKSGVNNTPAEVSLPGQKNNEPIQSTLGYLKDGTIVLSDRFDNIELSQFDKILTNFKRRPTSLKNLPLDLDAMQAFTNGVKDLLNIVLGSDVTKKAILGLAQNIDEIVFCIGYPTNWDEKDRALYENIVKSSVLGKYAKAGSFFSKKMRLMFERESTAAFVYIKLLNSNLFEIKKKDKVLILDFGSSTLNVTALTTDSRTTLYNSGHNFFGGKLIDCMIADYFLEMIPEEEQQFFKMFDCDNNGIATKLLILAACDAKERLSGAQQTRIGIDIIEKRIMLTRETLDMLLGRPMYPSIRKYKLIPRNEAVNFDTMSWKGVLFSYLSQEKDILAQKGIKPNVVILTGGGSILHTVQEVCGDIFGKVQMLNAMESTKTISKGLALAAKRADQSMQFDLDVQKFINERLPKVIEREVPSLAKELSAGIASYICEELVINELLSWRKGYVSTLNQATENIKSKCTSSDFSQNLQNNSDVKAAVKKWSMNTLGNTIAKELEKICIQYNVKNFKVGDLNVIKVPTLNVSGDSAIPLAEMDFIATIVVVITSIVAATLAPGLLVLIIQIIAIIMPAFAALIAGIISAIPGGIFIVAAAAGVAVFKLAKNGWESVRDDVIWGISRAYIPEFARKAVSKSRITASVNSNKADIEQKIYESMTSADNMQNIAMQTSKSLAEQIQAKMDEIRYILKL